MPNINRVRTERGAEGDEGPNGTEQKRCTVMSDWSFVSGSSENRVAQTNLHCHTCRKGSAETFVIQTCVLAMQKKLESSADNLVLCKEMI